MSYTRADLEEYMSFAVDVAHKAAPLIVKAHGNPETVATKDGPIDLVTEVDRAVEAMIFGAIKDKYPTHLTIGEESNKTYPSTGSQIPVWIVDPVDGTMNFVHGFPFTCISIGIMIGGKAVVGVIYNPITREVFTAVEGGGAKRNGITMKITGKDYGLEKALVMTELGTSREESRVAAFLDNFKSISSRCQGIRALGSAAMNMVYVATGGADAYFEFGLHCWDMAAAVVIVQEAGGCVIDTQGGPVDIFSRRLIVAVNEKIATEISAAIKVHLKLERDE